MKYYVNKNSQANGDHEVHTETCRFFSTMVSKQYLGDFNSCKDAVTEAKKTYSTADGCATCSPLCHSR